MNNASIKQSLEPPRTYIETEKSFFEVLEVHEILTAILVLSYPNHNSLIPEKYENLDFNVLLNSL